MTDNQSGIKPLTAAVVGAAVGAAAVILSDKDKRERLMQKAGDLVKSGQSQINQIKEKVDVAKDRGQDKLAESLETASKKIRTDKRTNT